MIWYNNLVGHDCSQGKLGQIIHSHIIIWKDFRFVSLCFESGGLVCFSYETNLFLTLKSLMHDANRKIIQNSDHITWIWPKFDVRKLKIQLIICFEQNCIKNLIKIQFDCDLIWLKSSRRFNCLGLIYSITCLIFTFLCLFLSFLNLHY